MRPAALLSGIADMLNQPLANVAPDNIAAAQSAHETLLQLSQDRKLETGELYSPNDYYGHAAILKQYAQISPDYRIKAAIEHSPFRPDFVWKSDINAPLPALFAFGPYRFAALKRHTRKAIFAIGPFIHYAPHYLNESGLSREKKRLGKNLLAFPAHSTHRVNADYNIGAYCSYLERIGREFDSVRVCLYWKDILRGLDEHYRASGFECITAGHIYDPLFLSRLKSFIETATITTSCIRGTYTGYSIALGKPHFIKEIEVTRSASDDQILLQDRPGNTPLNIESDRLIIHAFSDIRDDISAEQRDIIDRYWGLSSLKTRDDIRMLLQITDDMFQKGKIYYTNNSYPMPRQACAYLNEHAHQKALFLLDQALLLYPDQVKIHFGKAVALARLGRFPEALNALTRLLAAEPGHARACQLKAALLNSHSPAGQSPGHPFSIAEADSRPDNVIDPQRPWSVRALDEKKALWKGVRFLDPVGKVFEYEGEFYRAVYPHKKNYVQNLFDRGIIDRLIQKGLLVETRITDLRMSGAGMVLWHKKIPFRTYPEEWPASFLQDAALCGLDLNLELLPFGLGTIDFHCSNIQQHNNCAPVWIDFGSICPLSEIGGGRSALEEFLKNFMRPLYLLSQKNDLRRTVRLHLADGGIGEQEFTALAGHALPLNTANRLSFLKEARRLVAGTALLTDSTLWKDYHKLSNTTGFNPEDKSARLQIVHCMIQQLRPRTVIDLGANAGRFSCIASETGAEVYSTDTDEGALEKYKKITRQLHSTRSHTIVVKNVVYEQKKTPVQGDLVMALALAHHLSISQKYPFTHIAKILSSYTTGALLTEYMPNGLGGHAPRPNPLPAGYTFSGFLKSFEPYFRSIAPVFFPFPNGNSHRILILCTGKRQAGDREAAVYSFYIALFSACYTDEPTKIICHKCNTAFVISNAGSYRCPSCRNSLMIHNLVEHQADTLTGHQQIRPCAEASALQS